MVNGSSRLGRRKGTARACPRRRIAGVAGGVVIVGRLLILAVAILALGAISGCASSGHIVTEQRAALDSVRAVNERLRGRLRTMRDSLAFYDDIYAGQYWRDRRRLEQRIDRLRFEVARCADGGRVLHTYRAGALFEPASATLTDAGRERIDALARQLQAGSLAGRRLRIAGHTDDVPVGPSLRDKYPSNWELSAARAGAVLRHLVAARGLDPARFEITGFGASRPTATNKTAAGRRRNRRVTVTVLPEFGE